MTTESSRKFHFLREIASGGFGSVYLAKVIHADGFSRLAAIKLLHPKWSENEEIASRMRDEARLLGWLRHKNIVDVMDLTRIDGRVAVLMEYLEAVDFKMVVQHCAEAGLKIPVRCSLEACACVASALDAAYNRPPYAGEKPLRVIHRDIKPSNVMIDSTGTTKVLDFGVARADFDQRESHTQELAFGSLEYMPPERLFFEPESPASDVYSLGATLFEMLALEKFGKAKLRANDHAKHIEDRLATMFADYPMPGDDVEDEIRSLLTEMLAFDEEDRPTAADCVSRMRKLARRTGEPGLDEWCEEVIPPLVRAFQNQEKEHDHPTDVLVNQTLLEDSRGFMGDDASDVRQIPKKSPNSESDDDDPDSVHDTAADDERWHRLKQATLADLAELDGPTGPALRGQRGPPPLPAGVKERQASQPPTVSPVGEMAPDAPVTQTEDDGGGRGGTGLVLGALLGGFVLLTVGALFLVVVGLGVGLGGWSMASSGGTTASSGNDPKTKVDQPKTKVDQPETPITGPSARFVSGMPDTSKMKVDCGSQSGSGTTAVDIAVDKPLAKCTVTAVDSKRKRHTDVVENVEARTYLCFDGGAKGCK